MGGPAVRLACDPRPAPCPCEGGPCGYPHFRAGPVVDLASFDALAAECPRNAPLGMHENGQYVHVGVGGGLGCSGAYIAATMVRDGHWSYARAQLAAFEQRAELRRAAWHALPMPDGPCLLCRPAARSCTGGPGDCACGGACLLCHDCAGCRP